jgi:hypothetical protein
MFKSIFKSNKKKKLFKVVYKTGYSSYSEKYTSLVTGVNPADAIESFYLRVRDRVADILEFTEIKYNAEGTGVINEQIN